MLHQLFAAALQVRDIYPELKKYFYKENSNMTWEYFLTTKFGLWINTCLSTDNTVHGNSRAVEKSDILLQIKKAPEFSLEDAVDHLSVTNPSGILNIEKWNTSIKTFLNTDIVLQSNFIALKGP